MNEDIKRLDPYRVRFIGTPEHGLVAIEVNGRPMTITVAARLLSRSDRGYCGDHVPEAAQALEEPSR